MPNYTTNLNLKKPLGTENYNVEDQNGNMDIIDNGINILDAEVGVLTNLATLVKTSIVNAINSLKGEVDAHKAEFVQQLTESGYQKLPNGLIFQWGYLDFSATSSTADIRITFPITFPNSSKNVLANIAPVPPKQYWISSGYLNLGALSQTTIRLLQIGGLTSGNEYRIQWQAIGY